MLPIPWANNARLAQRQFTFNNRQWYEIGIRDAIGNYDLYQVYYLSEDGMIDAHIYSKGLQCRVEPRPLSKLAHRFRPRRPGRRSDPAEHGGWLRSHGS